MISVLKAYCNENLEPFSPLEILFSKNNYCSLDLSIANKDLVDVAVANPIACQIYIDDILKKHSAKVAYGGYLEQRDIYSDKKNFSSKSITRNIHLGVDFWTAAGTKVIAPLRGTVHSFQNNDAIGDYGPTIILAHEIQGFQFHTLYGHLSLDSIKNVQVGEVFQKGKIFASLGTSDINVNYAPHLHFQIIIDMEGKKGDYPGVCSRDNVAFYAQNCPNPNILLQL